MTSGSLVPVYGAITIPAGGAISSASYLYGVQGKVVTGTGSVAVGSAFVFGVFGRIEAAGGTLTSGHIAGLAGEITGLASGTASTTSILYLQHAGGGVANAFITAFGKTTYVFDFESNAFNQMSNTCTPSAVTGATGGLKVNVEGTTKWIPLAATCT
jgi:hypothetical protein